MISIQKALDIISSCQRDFGMETIDLSDSIGRVLREDWTSDRDMPPYHRVAMDGIAISFARFEGGQRAFAISEIAAAGAPQKSLLDDTSCIEVMTGAVLPSGCDTVIRYEDVAITDGRARVQIETVRYQQNVHHQAKDRRAGDLIVKQGVVISAAEIGIGASIGRAKVAVAKMPKIMVISTGDELVDINAIPRAYQIRKSNVFRLVATLQSLGITADSDHINDDVDLLRDKLNQYVHDYDAILLSGGVSKGKYDYLPDVLSEIGVNKLFHRIKQKPGKPFWFGQYKDSCTVFAFPGNPVSSFLCMHRYFRHWLALCTYGDTLELPTAVLTEDVEFKPALTYFIQVKLSYNYQSQILATPVLGNGSGDLANLVDADAFLELPSDRTAFGAGESFPFMAYR